MRIVRALATFAAQPRATRRLLSVRFASDFVSRSARPGAVADAEVLADLKNPVILDVRDPSEVEAGKGGPPAAVPGAVPPLTLINYIVDASGLTELNWPSLDLPVIGQVGGWAFLNSFPQYTPSDDLSIVTALSQFSTPGNALNP